MAAKFEDTVFGRRLARRQDKLAETMELMREYSTATTGAEKESFEKLAEQIQAHLKAFGTSS